MSTSASMVPCLILTSQGNCQFNILASFSYFLLYMKVQYIYVCTYIIMYLYMYVRSSGLSLKKRYVRMYAYVTESLSSATGIFTRTYTNDSSVSFHYSMCEAHVKADEFECPTAKILL